MIEYKVIKEIEQNPSHTQRSLAEKLNVSLGKVNYVLSGLVEKGIVKAKKLKNQLGQIRWHYVLTLAGVKEKVKITQLYFQKRMKAFEEMGEAIWMLKVEIFAAD